MAQEGAIVRNKRTGQMGRLVNGQVVPMDDPAPAQPMGDMIVKPAPVDKPPVYNPPSGYTGGPSGLTPIPGGPADPSAPQNQPKGGAESATALDLKAKAEGVRKRAATIRQAMKEVAGLYESDIKGQPAGRLFGAMEYVDMLPKNDRFRAAGNAILPLIRPLVAQTAKEGDSDKEMQVFMAYVPSNDDSDIAIEQKMKMLDTLIAGMAEGRPPSETEAQGGLSGTVSYEGPNPASSKPPEDIAAIMAKYGAR